MGDLSTLEVIIIAIVEGLTEFLPVSSTGHMIITQNLLGIESTEFVKAFTVIIQFGAILSVVWLYWKRFFRLNHTPVPAGHDYFDEGLFGRYMGEFPGKLGISWQEFIDMGRENPGSNEKFLSLIHI